MKKKPVKIGKCYLDKIKSLSIGTGTKPPQEPKLVGVHLVTIHRAQVPKRNDESQTFTA